jgi:competence protein ComEC
VGQGLSLLVRTAEHALLYDAGPSYAGGLDMGEATVVPALRGLGVQRLDAFVISHGDNDHAGGAGAVRRALNPTLSYAPNGWQSDSHALCESGIAWQWDGVRFAFLHPSPHFPYLGNDSSCVLRIDTASTSILLPGDISAVVEQRLLRDMADELDVDWLLVPHHGSRSSSSETFIDAVSPRVALVAVAHGSRFGHPHAEVVERYRQRGISLASTADSGALRVQLDGENQVEGRRETHRRFWHEP